MATPITSAEQLGKLLIQRRQEMRLTQSGLGVRIGKSQERVSRIEKEPGKVTLDQVMTVLMALDMELQLVPRKPAPSATEPRGEW